jgi:hypothetical protein
VQVQGIHDAFTRSSHDAGCCIQCAFFAPKPANAIVRVSIFCGKFDFEKIGKWTGHQTLAFEHLYEGVSVSAVCVG